jgi:hypothetical protein
MYETQKKQQSGHQEQQPHQQNVLLDQAQASLIAQNQQAQDLLVLPHSEELSTLLPASSYLQ